MRNGLGGVSLRLNVMLYSYIVNVMVIVNLQIFCLKLLYYNVRIAMLIKGVKRDN